LEGESAFIDKAVTIAAETKSTHSRRPDMNIIHKSLTAMAGLLIGASAFAGSVEPEITGVYLRTTAASVNLSSDGSPVTILQLTVPAGSWVVTAKANPVNFGAADYARCVLSLGTQQKDAGATLIGDASPGPTGEIGPSVAEIMLQTAVTTVNARLFKLSCQHDFATPGMYVDPGASIMVVAAPGTVG
jgi:hypothetical protein